MCCDLLSLVLFYLSFQIKTHKCLWVSWKSLIFLSRFYWRVVLLLVGFFFLFAFLISLIITLIIFFYVFCLWSTKYLILDLKENSKFWLHQSYSKYSLYWNEAVECEEEQEVLDSSLLVHSHGKGVSFSYDRAKSWSTIGFPIILGNHDI